MVETKNDQNDELSCFTESVNLVDFQIRLKWFLLNFSMKVLYFIIYWYLFFKVFLKKMKIK